MVSSSLSAGITTEISGSSTSRPGVNSRTSGSSPGAGNERNLGESTGTANENSLGPPAGRGRVGAGGGLPDNLEKNQPIIAHPTSAFALPANWWGLLGERFDRRWGRLTQWDLLRGIPGSPTNHHGVPFSLTEEFVAVYRMHPLIPDDFTFRSLLFSIGFCGFGLCFGGLCSGQSDCFLHLKLDLQ